MKKYIVLLALCLCQHAFATGPSRATLKMTPLSINEQGALLYKYKIITNPQGGAYLESVLYGVGSYKEGEFTSLQEQVVYGYGGDREIDYEKYKADVKARDQWLSSPCKRSDLMGDFTSCNLKSHAVNRLMSVAELRQKYGFDITKAVGYFLLPGKLQAGEDGHIYVTYAFNDFIVAEFGEFEGCWDGESRNPAFITLGFVDELNNFNEYSYDYNYFDCVDVTGIIVKE